MVDSAIDALTVADDASRVLATVGDGLTDAVQAEFVVIGVEVRACQPRVGEHGETRTERNSKYAGTGKESCSD